MRAHFCAFFARSLAKMRLLPLGLPEKLPNPGTESRKRGGKQPVLRLSRSPPGTPRLWPRSAKIARLDKTAFLP
jgi:hypothetical protein